VTFRAGQIDALTDAINGLGYGLTLGIHSRIDATVDRIVRRARVGNLYVNRNMIGAVVGVQPFGGEGLSGTGPKAGGPHYLFRLRRRADTVSPGRNRRDSEALNPHPVRAARVAAAAAVLIVSVRSTAKRNR